MNRFLLFLLPLLLLWGSIAGAGEADDYVASARGYFEKGELASAAIELQNALREDADHVPSHLLLGRIYLYLEDGPLAETEFRRARSLGAAPADWEVELAKAYLLQDNPDAVLNELSLEGAREPAQQARVMAALARAQLKIGNEGEARDLLEEANLVSAYQDEVELARAEYYLQREDLPRALQVLNALLERSAGSFEAIALRGQVQYRMGNLRGARRDLDEAIEKNPQNTLARIARATINIEEKKFGQAHKDIRFLNKRYPGNPTGLYLESLLSFKQDKLERARDLATKLLDKDPRNLRGMVLHGVSSFRLGDAERAIEYLKRAQSQDRDDPKLKKMLATLYLKQRNPSDVLNVLGYRAEQSEDVGILVLLGNAYAMKGDQDRANRVFARAVALAPNKAALRTQSGITLMMSGFEQKGLELIESAVEMGGDSATPDRILAQGHLQMKNYEQAIAASKGVEQKRPDDPTSYNLTGVIMLAKGDREGAEARFRKALEVDPEYLNAYVQLARVEIDRQDFSAAKAHFQSALDKDPGHFDALIGMMSITAHEGGLEATSNYYARLRESHPGAIQPHLLMARFLLDNGDLDQAGRILEDLAIKHVDNPSVLAMLAPTQLRRGLPDLAAGTYEKLAQLQPESASVQNDLGRAYLKAGNRPSARRALQKALSLEPGHLEALSALAALELQSGDARQALALSGRLVEEHPSEQGALRLRASILARLSMGAEAIQTLEQAYAVAPSAAVLRDLSDLLSANGQAHQAAPRLKAWLDTHPGDWATRLKYAQVQHQLGDPAAANAYRQVLEVQPDNLVALNNLAWLVDAENNPDALRFASSAARLAPANPQVADTLGWMLFRYGDREQALKVLQDAHSAAPGDPDIRFHLASVLLSFERPDDARPLLRELLRDTPEHAYADPARKLLGQ